MQQSGKSGKTKIITYIVIIIVVVAIVGVGAYFGYKDLTHKKSTAKTYTITVAAPVYSSSAKNWEDWINNATSAWQAAHPNVKIKFVGPFGASSEGDYYTKLDLMTSSPSTAPDVMLEDMFYTSTYASENVLAPLNNYVNSSVTSNIFNAALGQMTINGNIYGLPAQVTDTLIYYNITLFHEAGISTPWQPSNWTDIIHTAQILKDKLGSKISGFIPLNIYEGTRADEASSFTGFETLLYGTGYGLYNFSDHKWYGYNPGLNATLTFYYNAFVKYGLANPALSSTPYVTAGQYMQEGKLGIDIDGSWMYGYQWAPGAQHPINNFSKYIGVAKVPTEFGQKPYYTTMTGGWGWAMYSGVSNKPLVTSFISALANTTNQISINLPGNPLAGGLPTTKNAVNNPEFKELMPTDPSLDIFFANLLQYGHYRPPVSSYPKVSSALQAAMSAVVTGGKSVSAAMSGYYSQLVSLLGSSNVMTTGNSPSIAFMPLNNAINHSSYTELTLNINLLLQNILYFDGTPFKAIETLFM
ncbi:extracellular solute-binding protein [Picrophilus oshimae]|uniref:Glycerol-3-P ABC transporter solute binding protein n=1 Tax=Picrophilus torridus (strain ATCC 700027 / DSM 9790 / JCM 10055 / NBRC 100828 / KAW 2/3) TaxID=1122961 RepID=Q6L2X6_PICTO|nr:extracellular solute-binding protein [Picrophilus oshimae]AAT42675.1 glycerol-3-P ABC transporter solute binding protein [Picrophilus oshimae DSM 9789]